VKRRNLISRYRYRKTKGGITGELNYASRLFERSTIERWARYFERVLEQMSREPHRKVGDLELMDEPERGLITVGI
jgi:non-ribosomal peptide synthetase component F